MKRTVQTGVLIGLMLTGAAQASSDEAWAELRARLTEACTALTPDGSDATVIPNEVGSESYAVAMVVTIPVAGQQPETAICVMDKAKGTAELTVPFLVGQS